MRHGLLFIFLLICFACIKKDGEADINSEYLNMKYIKQDTTDKPISHADTIVATSDSIKAPVVGLEIGDIAPDLNLKDTSNQDVSLYSLRGKIVLIDFWATWCKPCRVENKKLIPLYDAYRDIVFKEANGFEIYCISIDRNTNNGWITYIKRDGYSWKYNVIDDDNRTASQLYKVSSIPKSFLVNGNGIIIARDLKEPMVEEALTKFLP